jgi:hypothetical protein
MHRILSKFKSDAANTQAGFSKPNASYKHFENLSNICMTKQQKRTWACLSANKAQKINDKIFRYRNMRGSLVMRLLQERPTEFFSIVGNARNPDQIFDDIAHSEHMYEIAYNHAFTLATLPVKKAIELNKAYAKATATPEKRDTLALESIADNFEAWSKLPVVTDELRRIQQREVNMDVAATGKYLAADAYDESLSITEANAKELKNTLKYFMQGTDLKSAINDLQYLSQMQQNHFNQMFKQMYAGSVNNKDYASLEVCKNKNPHFMHKTSQIIKYVLATAKYEHNEKVQPENSKLLELMLIFDTSDRACSDQGALGLMKLYIHSKFDNRLKLNISNSQQMANILEQVNHFGIMSDIEDNILSISKSMSHSPDMDKGLAATEYEIHANMLAKQIYGLSSPFNSLNDFNYSQAMMVDEAKLRKAIADSSGDIHKFAVMLMNNKEFRTFMQVNHNNIMSDIDSKVNSQIQKKPEILAMQIELEKIYKLNREALSKDKLLQRLVLSTDIEHQINVIKAKIFMPDIDAVLAIYGLNLKDYLATPRI